MLIYYCFAVNNPPTRKIGSIADMDPVNNVYGSLTNQDYQRSNPNHNQYYHQPPQMQHNQHHQVQNQQHRAQQNHQASQQTHQPQQSQHQPSRVRFLHHLS